MKNRKGFTLIEIMAVIIILAIIALIVVPLVTGSIKDSKDKLYDTQLENIKSAAKSYMINLDLDENQNKISVTLDELKKLGLADKDIKDPRTGEDFNKCLTVEITKNGDIYNYNIIDNIEDCNDTGNVIMTLIGSINENAYIDKPYVDPGVILKTDKGKYLDVNEITVEIVQYEDGNKKNTFTGKYSDLTRLIDTTKYYKYEITYIYDGPEGKASKVRNVEVKDTSNLQCLILPVGTKNDNGWIVDNRRVEIISINTNKKVEYSISETNEKKYSANQTLNVSKDGKVQVYGYIRDKEGNEAPCTSILKYEVGEPSCKINLSGTKSSTGWYTSNVTASLEPSIAGSNIVNKGISLSNTVDYNEQSSLIVSSSGNIYGYIKDEAGKEARCSSNVKIDLTPNISVTISGVLEGTNTAYTSGSIATSNVVLTGTLDPGTTASGYKYQWYKDNVAISGATGISYTANTNGNYKLVVTTGSGKTGNSNIMNVVIDTARPTCSLKVNSGTSGTNGWYTSNVTVGMSKVDATYYGTTTSNEVNYNNETSVTLSSTGRAYCYVASSSKTITNSNSTDEIKIDKTGPNIGLNVTNNNQSLTLTATARDPESGINRYEFYNGNTLLGTNTTGIYTINNLSNTSNNYKVKVYNNAGLSNDSTITESCSISSSSACVNGSITLVYTCTGTGRQWSVVGSCTMPTTTTTTSTNAYNYPDTTTNSGGSSGGCTGTCGPVWLVNTDANGNCTIKVCNNCGGPGIYAPCD